MRFGLRDGGYAGQASITLTGLFANVGYAGCDSSIAFGRWTAALGRFAMGLILKGKESH